MRLETYEIDAIKSSFLKIFGAGDIFLFGSRVDDALKGGDIDLYLKPDQTAGQREKRIDFLVELKSKIGEQKIDAVLAKTGSLIEKEALSKGIR